MSSTWYVTWHPPSGWGVLGHYSFRMQSVNANILRTTHATVYTFPTRSVRVLFLPDAECQRKYRLNNAYHVICLLDEESQGIFPSRHYTCLTDAECHGNFRPDWAYQGKYQDNAHDGGQHIGNRVVTVVASRRDSQGMVPCSEDYETIVTQSSSIDYI